MEAWIKEANENTPLWINEDADARIIKFDADTLVLTHPGHRPMIWRYQTPGWMMLIAEADVKQYTSPF